MHKTIFIFIFLSLGFFACNSNHTASPLKLENGQKWTANPETTEGIKNMQNLIKNTEHSETDLKGFLEKEFELIFKNCTMEGESHTQLHNYLIPLKQKIDKLGENSGQQKQEIEAYLKVYFDFFK